MPTAPQGSAQPPGSSRPASSTPSADRTQRIPVPSSHSGDSNGDPAEPTAALPVMRSETDDSEAATEKLNAQGEGDKARPRRRVGGGVSAQELLRREGRL
jgi:RND superfamily putative drug exporter